MAASVDTADVTRVPGAAVPFLRALLAGRPAQWLPLQEPRQRLLIQALRWHGVLPLLDQALRGGVAAGVPAAVRRAVRDGYLSGVAAGALLLPERDAVAAALRTAGVRAVWLKGAALAAWAYVDPALRPFGDLDVLVAESDLPAAAEALRGLGYRQAREEAPGLHHHWSFCRLARGTLPVTVEVHRRLLASPPYDRLLPAAAVLARAVPAASLGAGPAAAARHGDAVLEPADALLHAAAHLVLQHPGAERLIWVADVERILAAVAHENGFWTTTVTRAREAQLSLALSAALRMAAFWFHTPVPDFVRDALREAESAAETRIYHRLRSRAPVGQEGARLWADVRGVRGARAKAAFALAHLFPSPDYMRARHRLDGNRALPVYYARRLVRGVGHILARISYPGRRADADPPEAWMIQP